MGRATYYSPLVIGLALALMARDAFDDGIAGLAPWPYWLMVCGASLGFGLLCQSAMVGVQGLFAQVLPVPGGRSIRGRGATVGGGLILLTVIVFAAGCLMRWENAGLLATALLIAAGVAFIAFLASYAWCWPAAQRDFANDDRLG